MPSTRDRIGAAAGKALAAFFVLTWIAASASIASARPASTACFLGVTQRNTDVASDDWTGFTVYERLDPSTCAACGGAPLVLNEVVWWFRYRAALCPITFEVAIVASDHAACPKPDDSNVLCPAVTYVYQATGPAPHFPTVPLPAGCCISDQAFVRVRILDTGGCGAGTLGLGLWDCTGPCLSYAVGPEYPFQDSCDLFGSPSINVSADCCTPTPARPRSWGGVKLIYR